MDDLTDGFQEESGFPGILGAVDGCHISVQAPKEFQADYLDRTMKHSMNLMAVCDSKGRFIFVYCGSAHDQRVLSLSPLWKHIVDSEANDYFPSSYYHLVGDSAFTLVEHMMVPYKDNGNLTAKQLNFNRKLCQARHIIENAFAWLKGRFRKLSIVNTDIERVPDIILACCVLHNIALSFPDVETFPDVFVNENSTQDNTCSQRGVDHKGEMKRDSIANKL